jgi:DNA-binding response OmpR family regulator
MLPKKDGLPVCRELRAGNIHTPIIMLTARAQEIDKVLGLELGADDYITKPFSRRELHSAVKAALRRGALGASPSADIYDLEGLTIDFRRCEIRRHGKTTELTALEIKLLRTFLGRRGQVVTIDQLNEAGLGQGRVHHRSRRLHAHQQPAQEDRGRPAGAAPSRDAARVGYRFDS